MKRFPLVRSLFALTLFMGFRAVPVSAQTIWNAGINSGIGNWSNSAMWTPNTAPNAATADVRIDNATGTNSVVSVDGTFTIGKLTIDLGDTVGINNNQRLTVTNAGGAGFGAIINNGAISINSSNAFTDLTLSGNLTLSGTGTLTLQNFARITGTGVLTNASTIQGSSGNSSSGIGNGSIGIINQSGGLIDANVAGLILYVNPGLANGLVNQGLLRASNTGILVLYGVSGGGFNNTGGTISALNGSEVQFSSGASITGGILSTAGTGVIRNAASQTATLTGVSNTGKYIGSDNSVTNIAGTITNSGSILLESSSNFTDLTVSGNATLAGSGAVTLQNFARITGTGVLTNASTIQGSSGNNSGIGNGSLGIINQSGGLIDANVAGLSLYVSPNLTTGLVNQGQIGRAHV